MTDDEDEEHARANAEQVIANESATTSKEQRTSTRARQQTGAAKTTQPIDEAGTAKTKQEKPE